jgi:hypothetical protein
VNMTDVASLVVYGAGVTVSAAAFRWGPKRLGTIVLAMAAIGFVPSWIGMGLLCSGGSALQGGIDEDGYYLGRHGVRKRQVDQRTYGICLAAESAALLSHAVFVGGFLGNWRKPKPRL